MYELKNFCEFENHIKNQYFTINKLQKLCYVFFIIYYKK